MPGAIYLLLILIFITMAVLTVKFYLQVRNATPSRYDREPPEEPRRRERENEHKVYFVRSQSGRKSGQPRMQQVSSKNLFVLEQLDDKGKQE